MNPANSRSRHSGPHFLIPAQAGIQGEAWAAEPPQTRKPCECCAALRPNTFIVSCGLRKAMAIPLDAIIQPGGVEADEVRPIHRAARGRCRR